MRRTSLVAIVGIAAAITAGVLAAPSSSIRVIDGDTIGLRDGKPLVRLVGFNTPEIGSHARCAAERKLGEAARARLEELIGAGDVSLTLVPCACPRGTEGTWRCNFARRCGVMKIDGRDVADILINEELAVRFQCGETSCPAMPRPWCG